MNWSGREDSNPNRVNTTTFWNDFPNSRNWPRRDPVTSVMLFGRDAGLQLCKPVDHDIQVIGTRGFFDHDEPLPVGTEVVVGNGGAGAKRVSLLEQDSWLRQRESRRARREGHVHDHYLVVIAIEELLAVLAPSRLCAAVRRHLRLLRRAGVRARIDLHLSRFV